jgi:hypothetical protein
MYKYELFVELRPIARGHSGSCRIVFIRGTKLIHEELGESTAGIGRSEDACEFSFSGHDC